MRFNFICNGDIPKLWQNKWLHCCCMARKARLCSEAHTNKGWFSFMQRVRHGSAEVPPHVIYIL